MKSRTQAFTELGVAMGVDDSTIKYYARVLRLAGRIPTGPKGPKSEPATRDELRDLLLAYCAGRRGAVHAVLALDGMNALPRAFLIVPAGGGVAFPDFFNAPRLGEALNRAASEDTPGMQLEFCLGPLWGSIECRARGAGQSAPFVRVEYWAQEHAAMELVTFPGSIFETIRRLGT